MRRLLFILIFILLTCGCNEENKKAVETKIESNSVIIDVRTKEEYEQEHVANSINIPYDQIDELKKVDIKKTIYVYCASGNRSKKAYETFLELGYKVTDLGAINDINLPKE